MSYRVNVIAHTAGFTPRGDRPDPARELVTLAIQAPRTVLAEFNTHRALCRNVESSRAVSQAMRVRMLRTEPYVPGPTPDGLPLMGNNAGMVALTPLTMNNVHDGQEAYRDAALMMADSLETLGGLGWHKQDANRVSEPFSWTRICASGTRAAWNHFLWLRTADDVYPPFRFTARAIAVALSASVPRHVVPGTFDAWHLPYITDADREAAEREAAFRWGVRYSRPHDARAWRSPMEATRLDDDLAVMLLCRWSAARCATVSYYKFGDTKDYTDLEARFDTLFPPGELTKPVHASPAEHQAQLCRPGDYPGMGVGGNFGVPWKQYRKCLPGEYRPDFAPPADLLESWNVPAETFDPLT